MTENYNYSFLTIAPKPVRRRKNFWNDSRRRWYRALRWASNINIKKNCKLLAPIVLLAFMGIFFINTTTNWNEEQSSVPSKNSPGAAMMADIQQPKAQYSPEADAPIESNALVVSPLSGSVEIQPNPAPDSKYNPNGPDAELLGLSPQTRMALDKIRNTPSLGGPFNGPRESFSIDRAKESPSIFNKEIPSGIHEALEARENSPRLNVDVKKPEVSISNVLDEAYNALNAEEYESAIALYNQVLRQDEDNKIALFGLGVAYQRNKQSEQAREAYSKLLSIDPKNVQALNNYLMTVGDEAPEDALKEFEKLREVNPRFATIPAQEAMIELKLKNLEAAARHMVDALRLDPGNLQYKYNLAVILDQMGSKQQAIIVYHEVLEQAKSGQELPVPLEKIKERLDYLATP